MSMAAEDKMVDYTSIRLTPELFTPAAETFLSCNASREIIWSLFDEFDVVGNGTLDRNELR